MKKIIYSEAIKNSANLEKYKDKANWREDNPKSKSYIGNKPIKYKEMDKLFKQLQSVVKEIDNYIKNISLNNNILKFSYNNGDSKEIDLSQYQDLHLKSLEVDNLNKKLVGTLTDNVTKIEVDINDLINVNLNAGGLEDTNKRLKLTLSDDSILYIDLSKIYDKDVKNISLDDTNKKLVITKEDNSTLDTDLSSLDIKIDSVTFDKDTNEITITDNKSNSKTVNITGDEIKTRWLSNIVTYQNNWKDYNTTTWRPYIYKNREGLVIIKGLIRNGANNTVVCNLPKEYRPFMNEMCNSSVENNNYQRVDVSRNGDLMVSNEGTRNNIGWVNLDFCYHTISP